MKFGPVSLAAAEGAVLAHSVMAGSPQAQRRIRKGTVLTTAHLEALAAAGLAQVVVAQIDPDDMHEDLAATELAAGLAADPDNQGLTRSAATTGRVNLKAAHAGIVRVDADAILAANSIDPMLTIATLPPWTRVEAGQIIATVKVISYAVAARDVNAASAAAARALHVLPPTVTTATLIETTVAGTPLSDKGRRATAARLARFGVSLTDRLVVPHETAALAKALQDAPGEVLLILTASATSDIADTAPAAVRAAGGAVDHFGMPVDPGNLLFLGRVDGRIVIGLPGCARALAMNGADWVLERVLCGVPVTAADIAAMGVGGLLKDIPQRGRLRDKSG